MMRSKILLAGFAAAALFAGHASAGVVLFDNFNSDGPPVLNWSSFVHGFESLPVVIPYRN
jgi:hypothetical protein